MDYEASPGELPAKSIAQFHYHRADEIHCGALSGGMQNFVRRVKVSGDTDGPGTKGSKGVDHVILKIGGAPNGERRTMGSQES